MPMMSIKYFYYKEGVTFDNFEFAKNFEKINSAGLTPWTNCRVPRGTDILRVGIFD